MVQMKDNETATKVESPVQNGFTNAAARTVDLKPFQRKKADEAEAERRFAAEVADTVRVLADGDEPPFEWLGESLDSLRIQAVCEYFAQRWKLKDAMSEIAFRGLLIMLERCLLCAGQCADNENFSNFIDALGFHTVIFWKRAVPMLYESDMQYNTEHRDALLYGLTKYDVNSGRNRLRELFAAVPGLRSSMMAKSAKRFEQSFHVMMTRRAFANNLSATTSMTGGSQRGENDAESLSLLDELAKEADSVVSDSIEPIDEEDYEVDRTLHAHDRGYLHTITSPTVANGHGRLSPVAVPCSVMEARRGSLSRLFQRQSSAGGGGGSAKTPNGVAPGFERQTSTSSAMSGSDEQQRRYASGNGEQPDTVVTGGLCSGHFHERVINISNAPPVQLKRRRDSGAWEIGQGSGGLVNCCDPVMVKDTENVWLACFGPGVPFQSSRSDLNSPLPPRTNSLGLPLIRKIATDVYLSMLQEPLKNEDDEATRDIKDQMSVLGVLRDYNKENYKLNPVVVDDNDYNTYYGGISNGLLWPAFHTMPQYILKDYDDPAVLRQHWDAYVRVNYQFALNAVRKSRQQDFLWIHDYHLTLTGMIIQSLDCYVEVGFFLHIPFQPPEIFFTKFKMVAEAVVRGLMRFHRVGFQTHLDRKCFIDVVKERFPLTRIKFYPDIDKYVISYEGYTTTLGVFPVSIKNDDFISVTKRPSVQGQSSNIRQKYMNNRPDDGKMFFSVERFDFTKGIMQKMHAYTEYFRRYPDRIGKDVFLQVAVTNRRSVDTYREYQDECQRLADKLNEDVRSADDPDWRPLVFLTDGLNRPDLVAHYMAMDVGVVTPEKDGMNLVAKEMIMCNPDASLVISCGAGTEQQLNSAGFYTDADRCYHRVVNIHDPVGFAETLYAAAVETPERRRHHGERLSRFLLDNDIERWSSDFLDPSWTHDVVQTTRVRTLREFHALMFAARGSRCAIVERVLNGLPIKPHYGVSLTNVRKSLELSLNPETKLLTLTASEDENAKISATFDVTDEIRQLNIDLDFLNYVQSDEYDNLEMFLQDLSKYFPGTIEEFVKELDDVIRLLCDGDHFEYFFSDRDGTLRSYSCTYASSVQGAYSGVIQATFAHRCTQYAAIVTSAPLQNVGILDVMVMPDGYYCYGASCGREWYINSTKKFKDTSISDSELQTLNTVADRIAELLEKPEFRQFAYLGSGLQRHYGHVTVARQDVYNSIDENLSRELYALVTNIVNDVDPTAKSLRVSDTETDIKIHLKAKLSGKTFTKGHGVRLFADRMKLDLRKGNILVFGDSETDLPMLQEVLLINPQNVFTVWVTTNEDLKRKVVDMCDKAKNQNVVFVSSPFVILGAMAQATIREIKVRPGVDRSNASPADFDD